MAVSANKRKRPCDQCRAEMNWDYKQGKYLHWEKPGGIIFQHYALCCGEWVISFMASQDYKLTWRRPYPYERQNTL